MDAAPPPPCCTEGTCPQHEDWKELSKPPRREIIRRRGRRDPTYLTLEHMENRLYGPR